ncbi:unnamed protein product, partial [Allacma fusca]
GNGGLPDSSDILPYFSSLLIGHLVNQDTPPYSIGSGNKEFWKHPMAHSIRSIMDKKLD